MKVLEELVLGQSQASMQSTELVVSEM